MSISNYAFLRRRALCARPSAVAAFLCIAAITAAASAYFLNHTRPGLTPAAAPGLVAAYGFSESSGVTTLDASGNNNTGALLGGAAFTGLGKYGNAIAFNGADASVRIAESATWKVNGLTGYTASLWVKVKSASGDYKIALGTGSWPENDLYIDKVGGAWSFGLHTTGGPNNWSCGGQTSNLPYLSTVDNTYHHVALVLNAAAG